MGIDISPVATRLLTTIEEYIKETSKTDYRFTLEEQAIITRNINILNKHLDILIDYEIKKRKEEQ